MTTDPVKFGTKWLKFWTYLGLPVLTIVAFLVALDLPRMRYENLLLAALCVTAAVGLHKRQLWAWQLNLLLLVLIYVAALVPLPIRDFNGSFPDVVAQWLRELISTRWSPGSLAEYALPFVIRLVVASLFWLWPNWVYWTRRKALFS